MRVEFAGGKITRIVRLEKLSGGSERIYIAPGLIDNQVNGYMGVSFVDTGSELDEGGIHKITSSFWKEGVTTYLPTLTTNDLVLGTYPVMPFYMDLDGRIRADDIDLGEYRALQY